MISDENIQRLYDKIDFRKEISAEELQKLGFSSSDISVLVLSGKIKSKLNGKYIICDVEEIYTHGVKAIRDHDYPLAYASFRKCLEFDPTHYNSLLQIIINYIKEGKYDFALAQIELIMRIDGGRHVKDGNLYLLLLSYIIELPFNHVETIMHLSISDLSMSSLQNILDLDKYRIVLEHSLGNRFSGALRQLNKLEFENNCETAQSILIKVLLRLANEKQKQNKGLVARLAKDEKYEEIIQFIERERQFHRESQVDRNTLQIAKAILDIESKHTIPTPTVHLSRSLGDALEGENYREALEHNEIYINKNKIPREGSIINILLKKIVGLINSMEDITLLDQASIVLIRSYNYMLQGKEDLSSSIIEEYFSKINKNFYTPLILSLTKWAILYKGFDRLREIYLSIINGNFEIDLNYFIENFYLMLQDDKIKDARMWFNIIYESCLLGKECEQLGDLEDLLYKSERLMDKGKNISVLVVNDSKKEDQQYSEQTEANAKIPDDLLEIMQHAKNYGVALLKPMNKKQRGEIYNILKNIPNCNFVIFSIGKEPNRRLVLRYRPLNKSFIPILDTLKAAGAAAKQGDFNTALKKYRDILELKKPEYFVYAKIGIIYLKMGNSLVARDYMIIATELSKQEDNRYDFTDLIDQLNKSLAEVNIESETIGARETEDHNNELDYYGITDIENIIDWILSGTPMEEVFSIFELNSEEKLLVMLVIAREYYIEEKYSLGDIYLKAVENSYDKTSRVDSELKKIKANRNFYKNRKKAHNSFLPKNTISD